MERHFSTGVVTIVALMTAHRSLNGDGPQAFSELVARINTYLSDGEDGKSERRVALPAE